MCLPLQLLHKKLKVVLTLSTYKSLEVRVEVRFEVRVEVRAEVKVEVTV